ncbi:MAG: fumarate reductase subunit C [Betaproteobacteria bacterium]|nr:fumarate reductase subunit C [Betaproteobacteria bacterium]MDH5221229.1 fumarate reductase subunit C [Betaproteobacteria bacterium]MDH5351533.1 fumarate reductase subunit C [Betaproteobacteria bacterium]
MSRRPYARPITSEWIFRHPRYIRYMVREFSCLFIGGWTLLMVWGFKALSEGPAAWAAFLELLQTPASIVFHLLTLAFAAYHSVTWFNLTPKALPVQLGEEFLPDRVISGAHFAAWAAVSAGLLYFAGAF